MQFTTTVFALVGALAASASAQYGSNATIPAVPAGPTGTGTGSSGGYPGNGSTTLTTPSSPGATGYEPPSQIDNGVAGRLAGSGLALLVAGGVAFAL